MADTIKPDSDREPETPAEADAASPDELGPDEIGPDELGTNDPETIGTADDDGQTGETEASEAPNDAGAASESPAPEGKGGLAGLLVALILVGAVLAAAWVTRPDWQPMAVEALPALADFLPPVGAAPAQPGAAVGKTRVAEGAPSAPPSAESDKVEAKDEAKEETLPEAKDSAEQSPSPVSDSPASEPPAPESSLSEVPAPEASASEPAATESQTEASTPQVALAPEGSSLEDRIAALEKLALSQGAGSLSRLEQDRTRFRDQLTGLMSRLDGLEGRVTEVNKIVQATMQGGEGATAGQTLERINDRLAKLEESGAELESVKARLAGLENEAKALDLANRQTEDRLVALEARPVSTGVSQAGQALVLAVSQLQAAARRSGPFDGELAALRSVAGDRPDLEPLIAALAAEATTGAATVADLRTAFPAAARAAKQAEGPMSGGSWWEQTLNRLSGLVTIRRIDGGDVEAGGTDAALARAGALLDKGDLSGALKAMETLSDAARSAAGEWTTAASGRLAVEKALAALHVRAVASLSQAGGTTGKSE
ncbi:MAG: mitofilin family membrane protein [Rhodospirillales bacterium]